MVWEVKHAERAVDNQVMEEQADWGRDLEPGVVHVRVVRVLEHLCVAKTRFDSMYLV